jgi:hypothetical protein
MFYTEEDIQPVVDTVVRTMGPNGTMVYGDRVLKNIIVSTREFGKIWYGDFEGSVEQLDTIISQMSSNIQYKMSWSQDT